MYKVQIKGMDELREMIRQAPDIVGDELEKAMRKSVITISSNVKRETPVGVSGRLRSSIGDEVKRTNERVTGRVGTSITDEYPLVMEFGRRPGARRPPSQRLERWVHLQMGVSTDQAPRAARYVARMISVRGIRGREMFRKGLESSLRAVEGYFGDALLAMVRKMGD